MDKEPYIIYTYEKLKKENRYINQMKIYKILYFANAYALAKNDSESFKCLEFQAWANGPVLAEVRNELVHNFYASLPTYIRYYKKNENNIDQISNDEKNAIDAIIQILGDFSSEELSALSHGEGLKRKNLKSPWEKINGTGKKSKKKISKKEIKNYYNMNFFNFLEENKERIKEKING